MDLLWEKYYIFSVTEVVCRNTQMMRKIKTKLRERDFMIGEKKIALAFFDILGTSKRLNENELQKVYEYYECMVKLCSDDTVPVIIENSLYGKSELIKYIGNQKPFVLLQTELKNAFFSDTFIMWVELDEQFNSLLVGFFEKCAIVFCEALRRKIPLRGTISVGTAIMDEEKKIFLGKPLVEAAKGETCQNWLGIGLGKSFKSLHTMDTRYVLPYTDYIKTDIKGSNEILNNYALDWPRWWRENDCGDGYGDINSIIADMNLDTRFAKYYENCLRYYEYSKDGDSIWEKKTGIHGITKQILSDLIEHSIVMDC